MTVSVLCWAYNHSNKALSLQKTNFGYTSLEILITRQYFDSIKQFIPYFQDIEERKNLYKKIIEIMEIRFIDISEFQKYIKREINSINKTKITKYESEIINELRILYRQIFEGFKEVSVKEFSDCGVDFVIIYLSFWPASGDTKISNSEVSKRLLNLYISINNNFKGLRETKNRSNNFYNEDLRDTSEGLNLKNYHSFLREDNLEIVRKVDNYNASISREKKEKIVYRVKIGPLKDTLISSDTFNKLKSIWRSLPKPKISRFEFSHKIDTNDEERQKINTGLSSSTIGSIFKSEIYENEELIKLLEEDIYKWKNEIYQIEFEEKTRKIRKYETEYIKKLMESIKNNEKTIENAKSKITHINEKINSYSMTEGFPPSHIVSLPSKGTEGYGLDEVKIINNWINNIISCGFGHDLTNCSWALLKAISIETDIYEKAPLNKKVSPIKRSLMSVTPKEVADYASKIQEKMFTKFKGHIKSQLNRNIPDSSIINAKTFKEKTKGSNVFGVFTRSHSSNITTIDKLLDEYKTIPSFLVSRRLGHLDKLSDAVLNWLESKADSIAEGRSKRANAVSILFQDINLEKSILSDYLYDYNSNLFKATIPAPPSIIPIPSKEKYLRFLDIHVAGNSMYYDFSLDINVQMEYQKRKLTNAVSFIYIHYGKIKRSKNQISSLKIPVTSIPETGYVAATVTVNEIRNLHYNNNIKLLLNWISDKKYKTKLRINSHGNGDGNFSMDHDNYSTEELANWLVQGGVYSAKDYSIKSGEKKSKGLATIHLFACMVGRNSNYHNTEHAYTDPVTKNKTSVEDSAIDRLINFLRNKGIFGVEVTGTNNVVFNSGGKPKTIINDHPSDLPEGSSDFMTHSNLKIREIS